MMVQAEVTIYPLRIAHLSGPINKFRSILESRGIEVHTGPLSTSLAGESQALFTALQQAFEVVAEEGQLALIIKISNACPGSSKQVG